MSTVALETSRQCARESPRRLWLMNAVATPILAMASHVMMNSGRLLMKRATVSPFISRSSRSAQCAAWFAAAQASDRGPKDATERGAG